MATEEVSLLKRWPFAVLAVVLVAMGTLVSSSALAPRHSEPRVIPHAGLIRMPHSAYKYSLCSEAFAFAHATADNPYKTDFSFLDPFRKVKDTIVPHLLDFDAPSKSVSFAIDVLVNNVASFHITIDHIQETDGISVALPDMQNRLKHSVVPLFVVSSFGNGRVAILDFTCAEQWDWQLVP